MPSAEWKRRGGVLDARAEALAYLKKVRATARAGNGKDKIRSSASRRMTTKKQAAAARLAVYIPTHPAMRLRYVWGTRALGG